MSDDSWTDHLCYIRILHSGVLNTTPPPIFHKEWQHGNSSGYFDRRPQPGRVPKAAGNNVTVPCVLECATHQPTIDDFFLLGIINDANWFNHIQQPTDEMVALHKMMWLM